MKFSLPVNFSLLVVLDARLLTIAILRPPTASFLKITNCCFHYAASEVNFLNHPMSCITYTFAYTVSPLSRTQLLGIGGPNPRKIWTDPQVFT